jgi:hypothetical protein
VFQRIGIRLFCQNATAALEVAEAMSYQQRNGFLSSSQVITALQNPELRFQDDPTGIRIARQLLRNPQNHSLQRWFEYKLTRRVSAAVSASNPAFHANYPPPRSLPLPQLGFIYLCYLLSAGWLVMPVESLTRNLGVFGSAGSGKTNWLRSFVPQLLMNGVTVIAFDAKGKGELVDSSLFRRLGLRLYVWRWQELRLAPLECPPWLEVSYWANLLVSLFSSQWTLFASTTLLVELIHDFFQSPGQRTFDRLIAKAEAFKAQSYRSEQYKDVLVRNLRMIFHAFGREVINAESSNMIELMTRDTGACHLVLTDGLPVECASLLASLFLLRDYEYRRCHEEAQRQIGCYVFDDAMRLFHSKASFNGEYAGISPLEVVSYMGRSLGLSLCVSMQNISHCSSYFLQNCDTLLTCGCYGDDCRVAQRVCNLTNEQAEYLSMMRPGEIAALCRSVWSKCVVGYAPRVE